MTDSPPRTTGEVQAHRGASAVAPENTIAAFLAASEQGIAVRVWTCNDPAQIAPFRDQGLGTVITDNPSLFLG